GRHRQRIARESSCLIHRSQRRDSFHHLSAPTESSDREPAPDNLSQTGQVRLDAVKFLSAAISNPKAGDHLVKYQQRTMLNGSLTERFKKSRAGRDAAHVAGDRFDDDAGDQITLLFKSLCDRGSIVVRKNDSVLRDPGGDAGAIRCPES